MRTPSLYVEIGVESFSVVVIGLHHRIGNLNYENKPMK